MNQELERRRMLIQEAAADGGGGPLPRLADLLRAVDDLYQGRWPSHEPCQVGYHTQEHALEVALATARMAAGYRRVHPPGLPPELLAAALAAALFHDAGYIKDKGDTQGNGGKYTFTHVPRSAAILKGYLEREHWPRHLIDFAVATVGLTEFHQPVDPAFADPQERDAAAMVASADLLAQMADPKYLENIHHLFAEFQEAYRLDEETAAAASHAQPFASAAEIIDQTDAFYHRFVLPRLAALGDMGRYLVAYFGADRNPYQESIAANLATSREEHHGYWQRLGELLTASGALSTDQLAEALDRQAASGPRPARPCIAARGYAWLDRQLRTRRLGNLLLADHHLDPATLRTAVIDQLLPPELELGERERSFLLHLLLLLQYVENGDWLFGQILAMARAFFACRTATIWVADGDWLHPRFTAPQGTPQVILPRDKGLAGWVLVHDRPRRLDKGSLAAPIHLEGNDAAVLELTGPESGGFDRIQERLAGVAATLIGNSLAGALWLHNDCPEEWE